MRSNNLMFGIIFGILALGISSGQMVFAEPGTHDSVNSPIIPDIVVTRGLEPVEPDPNVGATFFGHGGYSADGAGVRGSGTLLAEIPPGSTVEQVYLYSTTLNSGATTVTVNFDGTQYVLAEMTHSTYNGCCSLKSFKHTSPALVNQVKDKVGSGSNMPFSFPFTEISPSSSNIDGVGLVVIFSNPAFPESSIIIGDGGLPVTTQKTIIGLAEPLDKTVDGFEATLSLGIGFSFPGADGSCYAGQVSRVEINGQRLTSCAGGADDGFDGNGGLFTIGGVGDDTNNPPDPNGPGGLDDELYNIAGLLSQGDTKIEIDTENFSSNDIIFLAIIQITARASVGEICGDGIDNDDDGLIDEGCMANLEPITEVHCDYDDETNVALNGVLNYTVNGTCDIHRGDDIEMKNMTLNVEKEIIPREVNATLYLTGSYLYDSNADGSTSNPGYLWSSDISNPTHSWMPIDMVGDSPDAGIVDRLQSFLLQSGDNTFTFSGGEHPIDMYGLGLFFSTDPNPFIASEPVIGFLVGYSSTDGNPSFSVPVVGKQITSYDHSHATLPYTGAVSGSVGNAYVMITEFAVDNSSGGPTGHFTVNLGELAQPCSDQTGTFTITFEDESGTIIVNEAGEICQEDYTIEFSGTNTSVQGTGEFEDIDPQCGNVEATITLGEGDDASGMVWIMACPDLPRTSGGGGMNNWDTRPTFGISHEDRANQVVENGFRFNTNEYMLTDNHHTDFAEQSVDIGTVNSFSATVYADKKLKIQEFLFGIPNVGEAHLAELGVEVWYDRDGEIEDVKVVQKSDVIDADTVSVSHEKVKCLSTDAEAKCDTTTVSMTFLEPLMDKVMAIKAIDYALRDQRTFLNEGFDISGDSLNPMYTKMIPSNLRDQGLLKVTQVAKYSPYWEGEDGRTFEMNSFGSFKQINKSFERFQDTGNAFSRMHSGFGGIIAYEQDRATDLFDSSKLISEIPESFAYIYPQTGERLTDEMLQEMQLQAEIAQGILDEMDKQDRHY